MLQRPIAGDANYSSKLALKLRIELELITNDHNEKNYSLYLGLLRFGKKSNFVSVCQFHILYTMIIRLHV